ncbi:hypothetical protein EH220_01070 [bacterium]|nr:MAG: hypothetical protein EH220_01070 [bacterium]
MDRLSILKALSFGHQVAEDEKSELADYFVSTNDWERMYAGDIDIVYGAKGSGKSAIYFELLNKKDDLFSDSRIRLIPAERPSGSPVFVALKADPPTSETDFNFLWKLYFLSLIVSDVREEISGDTRIGSLVATLESAKLLERDASLASRLRAVSDYIKRFTKISAVEPSLSVDPNTQALTGVGLKISFHEPGVEDREQGVRSVDQLFSELDSALYDHNLRIWIALDRLDVAFAESSDLEENALRSLFRVYIDLRAYSAISLKLFLRTDIWRRITRKGFREATHITRIVTLDWNESNLLFLIVNRLLSNSDIVEEFGVDPEEVRTNREHQERLFYEVFPDQMEGGSKKPSTFRWMLRRVEDGEGKVTPRELIQLLSAARDAQIHRLEIGTTEKANEKLFSAAAIRDALPGVSKTRLEQYLYAEYHECREWIERLRGQGTNLRRSALQKRWKCDNEELDKRIARLIEIGFFRYRNGDSDGLYHVPYLFQSALDMVQRTDE